ncbi:hypothetical protein [Actinoplanes sp. NPDC049265]|uniref:hypothetical protein n=1 Tax=Actinoplanes sp. NPDC049265 TaxID=3363902 RepID=UPI00372471CD
MTPERLRWQLAGARAERDWWRARAAEPQPDAVEVVVAIGHDAEALRALTASLAHDTGPATVVVTDCPGFRHARAAGVLLEYLPDAATWERHRPGVPWDDLLTRRLTRILLDHGPGHIRPA